MKLVESLSNVGDQKMRKYKLPILAAVAMLFAASTILFAYSVFTNETGYARRYQDSDIPFVYMLNNITPADYVPAIDAGTQVWEDVPSSYWEFENGGFTSASTDERDGINLIFFDIQGVNFTPGTNTIAYSRTWTSGTGSAYHAVESDLVWNARDYPPSTTGALNQQDLQSVIAHEVGHHLGLGHSGPAGSPPGVGPLILQATMYGTSANGDTLKRSLHWDDIAGVSYIYPSWILQGNVTDGSTGLPFANIGLVSDTVFASIAGDPIFGNNRYQRPGYYVDTVYTASDGSYQATILQQQFNLTAVYFGYESQTQAVAFNPAGGIGQTEVINLDFQLLPNPMATLSGTVIDSISGAPISARVEIFATNNKPGIPPGALVDTTTDAGGNYQISLPTVENYRVVITPEAPYPAVSMAVENLPQGGAIANFALNPADILLVDDDNTTDYESYYEEALTESGLSYHKWRVSEEGVPSQPIYDLFPQPCKTIWFTGDANSDVLSANEQQSLVTFLDDGGRLLLTGQNVAENSTAGVLFTDYLGVSFNQNMTGPIVRGVAGDPIGNGLLVSTVGGAGNQLSKDDLAITGSSTAILTYGTGAPLGNAGVRAEDYQSNWKAVFLGFGLEGVNNSQGIRDQLLQRTLAWFDVPTGIGDGNSAANLPDKYSLQQNYPNPFNPTTSINYQLPMLSRVELAIYNVLGQKIRTLVSKKQTAGRYSVDWNGRDDAGIVVPSGIYLYRLNAETFVESRKMVVIK